jgi:hypothetical protein
MPITIYQDTTSMPWRQFLEVAVLLQPLVDFTHSLGLIVPQDDGEQEAAFCCLDCGGIGCLW